MPATAPTFWIVFTNAAASAAAERPPPISLTVMIAITGNIDPRSEPYPATDSAAMGLVGMAAGAEAGGIAVLQSQRRPSRRRPPLGRPERRHYPSRLHLTDRTSAGKGTDVWGG